MSKEISMSIEMEELKRRAESEPNFVEDFMVEKSHEFITALAAFIVMRLWEEGIITTCETTKDVIRTPIHTHVAKSVLANSENLIEFHLQRGKGQ